MIPLGVTDGDIPEHNFFSFYHNNISIRFIYVWFLPYYMGFSTHLWFTFHYFIGNGNIEHSVQCITSEEMDFVSAEKLLVRAFEQKNGIKLMPNQFHVSRIVNHNTVMELEQYQKEREF